LTILILLAICFILKFNSLVNQSLDELTTSVEIRNEKRSTVDKIQTNITYFQTNTWIFNNRVFQYSSHLFIQNGKPTQIDSIIMTIDEVKESIVNDSFICLLKSVESGIELYYEITKIYSFKFSNAKRVKCDIRDDINFEINNIVVAIINKLDFINGNVDYKIIKNHKIPFKLPWNMISFQKPRIIYKPVKKIKKVAHCLHYTYNINQIDVSRILKWLDYQKSVGIDKIIIYNSDKESSWQNEIYLRFDKKFVDLRKYYIKYDDICDVVRLNKFKLEDISKYLLMKKYCEDLFYNKFDDPVDDPINRWKHQKLSCNDCYTSFEHVYEFVSYYDFDEIIYPRKSNLEVFSTLNIHHTPCNETSVCQLAEDYKKSFNLYEFTKDLIKRSYTSKEHFISLYFPNAFYLEENDYVKQLMLDMNKVITENKTFFKNNTKSNNMLIHFKFTKNHGHIFVITPKDYNHIEMICNTYKMMSCIYNKFNDRINKNLVHSTFKRYLYFISNDNEQLGKLIHFTDNVYALHTHYPLFHLPNNNRFNLNAKDAVLMHFRSDLIKKAKDQNSSITNLKIDLEYYLHLISNFSSICLK
jgi:hypothetical protein